MRAFLSLLVVATTIDLAAAQPPPAPGASPGSAAPAIPCRALEVHADPRLNVTVVVFHQRDDADRGKLGELLRGHDGTAIAFRTSDGAVHPATMMRLKSCFGRGLLVFPASAARLSEKDDFVIGEPAPEVR
ncbi:MAG TPA: hypothetical protein VL691_04115 [Vicinamibacteria bacterium]|nr:hypothetical protein [Vicinamibacteria bacterium]